MPLPLLPVGIENRANQAFAEFKTLVDAYQTDYFSSNQTYWQGLLNPPTVPQDGNENTVDKSVRPTDQTKGWEDIALSTQYPISVEVHTHGRHADRWYSLIGRITIAGEQYMKVDDGEWFKVIND